MTITIQDGDTTPGEPSRVDKANAQECSLTMSLCTSDYETAAIIGGATGSSVHMVPNTGAGPLDGPGVGKDGLLPW